MDIYVPKLPIFYKLPLYMLYWLGYNYLNCCMVTEYWAWSARFNFNTITGFCKYNQSTIILYSVLGFWLIWSVGQISLCHHNLGSSLLSSLLALMLSLFYVYSAPGHKFTASAFKCVIYIRIQSINMPHLYGIYDIHVLFSSIYFWHMDVNNMLNRGAVGHPLSQLCINVGSIYQYRIRTVWAIFAMWYPNLLTNACQ